MHYESHLSRGSVFGRGVIDKSCANCIYSICQLVLRSGVPGLVPRAGSVFAAPLTFPMLSLVLMAAQRNATPSFPSRGRGELKGKRQWEIPHVGGRGPWNSNTGHSELLARDKLRKSCTGAQGKQAGFWAEGCPGVLVRSVEWSETLKPLLTVQCWYFCLAHGTYTGSVGVPGISEHIQK